MFNVKAFLMFPGKLVHSRKVFGINELLYITIQPLVTAVSSESCSREAGPQEGSYSDKKIL